MAMKLLIGYDGSTFARDSIIDLRRAGLPMDIEAVVLSAADVWPHIEGGADDSVSQCDSFLPIAHAAHELAERAKAEAKSSAAEGVEFVRSHFPNWQTTAKVVSESAGRALVEFAETWKPDLLVLGARGRSGAAQFMLRVFQGVGSVADRVLRFAPCSVRIGRRLHEANDHAATTVRLVLGIDGSTASASVVESVSMRKWPAGSEARLVAAVDLRMLTLLPFIGSPNLASGLTPARGQTWARRAVDKSAEELKESGLSVTTVVLEGDAQSVLLHEAAEWGADCIVVGAHGLSRFERFMLGTVSATVAERANCSVEVVRHPASAI